MDKYVEEFSQDLRNLNLSELEIIDVIIEDLKIYLKKLSEKRTSMISENLDRLYACKCNEVLRCLRTSLIENK